MSILPKDDYSLVTATVPAVVGSFVAIFTFGIAKFVIHLGLKHSLQVITEQDFQHLLQVLS